MNNLEARRLMVGEMVDLNGRAGVIQRIENNSLVISWLSQALSRQWTEVDWHTGLSIEVSIIPYDDPLIAALERRPRPSGAM
jgi:hypothetical protein